MSVTDKNRLSITHPELCKEWDYEKNGDLKPEDVSYGSNKKVWWKCHRGHEFESSPNERTDRGYCSKCPYCSGRYASTENNISNNKELMEEWSFQKNIQDPRKLTAFSHQKVWWKCKKCSRDWPASIKNRHLHKTGCPYCSGNKICEDNCLATVNPVLAAQLHPTKNGAITAKDIMGTVKRKIWWICSKGHEWPETVCNRKNGNACPYCSGRKPTPEHNLGNNLYLVQEWNFEKNVKSPSEYTPNSNRNVWWKCHRCQHEWTSSINGRTQGRSCPKCRKIVLKDGFCCDSLVEAYFYLKLKSKKINFVYDKKYSDANKTRYDFYFPQKNLYVEITSFRKDSFKKVSKWITYLRNIVRKKRRVENSMGANFRFIQYVLNQDQINTVRKNMK